MLDPNLGACEVLGLEAKNKLFPKGELHLPTCMLTPVKPLKLTVVFMQATPAEGFLMVPGVAPLKKMAPVKGPLLLLMAAMKLSPLEAAMTLLLLLLLEMVTKLVFAKNMVCSKKDGISTQFS